MASLDGATVTVLIRRALDCTRGDAAFLSALVELRSPVRARPMQRDGITVKAECLRLMRGPRRSRRAIMWIRCIRHEHACWRDANPTVPRRPAPELLALPAMPSVSARATWSGGEFDAVVRYVTTMARRRVALAEFVQARMREYQGIRWTGEPGPEQRA